ncbi:hypothetical protein HBH49_197380 [Parastagonospora nodorum]|nr:hypothetical protein HBH49_197380 [Parastagonospora nodorum]
MNLALLLNLQGARKRGDADCVNNNNNNVAPTLQFSLTALLNPRSLASKRSALSSSDLNCGRTNSTIATLLAKRIKTDEDCKKSTHRDNDDVQLVRDNMEELIYVTGNNCNNLNIIVTNPTGREFGRVDMKSSTRLSDVANVFDMVISKLDKVPTRELSTLYFMWDKEQDYSAEEHDYRKFYHLVITGEDTHYKQTIKKAYIMSLERALLILFMT